jgi:hypothetical protein
MPRQIWLYDPIRTPASILHWLVLPEIAGVIQTACLQIGVSRRDFGDGCLGQNFRRDVVDRRNRRFRE